MSRQLIGAVTMAELLGEADGPAPVPSDDQRRAIRTFTRELALLYRPARPAVTVKEATSIRRLVERIADLFDMWAGVTNG